MSDLFAFGLEPQEPPAAAESEDTEPDGGEVWSACVDCEHAGYDVNTRSQHSVPLCPTCVAEREGLL